MYEQIFIKRDKLKEMKVLSEYVEKIVSMGIGMEESMDQLKSI